MSIDVEDGEPATPTSVLEVARVIAERKRAQRSESARAYAALESLSVELARAGVGFLRDRMTQVRDLWSRDEIEISNPRVDWGGPESLDPADDAYKPATDHYYNQQFVALAREHEYWANRDELRLWLRLRVFYDDSRLQFVCGINHVGRPPTGVMSAAAFAVVSEQADDDDPNHATQVSCTVRPFTFTLRESGNANERFLEWLDGCLSLALAEWGRQF
jgi:hypothetical protein